MDGVRSMAQTHPPTKASNDGAHKPIDDANEARRLERDSSGAISYAKIFTISKLEIEQKNNKI